MKKEIVKINKKIFEEIKHIDEEEDEYWLARELMPIFEYSKWENFHKVIKLAMISCKNSGIDIYVHFPEVRKLSINVNGGQRRIQDYKLSRYACYLIAQNGDSKKEVIALAQTYFATQTRKQELFEKQYKKLSEEEKRIYKRKQIRTGNYNLNKTAIDCGVKDLGKFHNAGYQGLYNGETADDIFKRKGLSYRDDILDNMCTDELILNLFRISQTNQKLRNSNVDNEYDANSVHYNIGKHIRRFIEEEGGIMPENMPTPKTSLKKIKNKNNKELKR